jgi:CRP-like cAMP-binding protein
MPLPDIRTAAAAHPGLAFLPRALLERAHAVTLAAGELLFRTGDRPDRLYFVLDGELVLVRTSRSGREVVLQRARSGFLAEASVESRRYHCDGVARTKSGAYAFSMAAFREALAADESFRAAWMRHLTGEIRRLRAQSERLALNSAAERVVHYVESEGEGGAVELRQSLKSWALDLGLTHEALYRALARMERSGEITREGARIALRAGPSAIQTGRPARSGR